MAERSTSPELEVPTPQRFCDPCNKWVPEGDEHPVHTSRECSSRHDAAVPCDECRPYLAAGRTRCTRCGRWVLAPRHRRNCHGHPIRQTSRRRRRHVTREAAAAMAGDGVDLGDTPAHVTVVNIAGGGGGGGGFTPRHFLMAAARDVARTMGGDSPVADITDHSYVEMLNPRGGGGGGAEAMDEDRERIIEAQAAPARPPTTRMCIICGDRENEVVYTRCGHLQVCMLCAERSREAGNDRCPSCNKVSDFIKIFT